MMQQPKLVPNMLLAKSYQVDKWKGSYSLVGHTADVVNAITTIVDVMGDRLIKQFKVSCSFPQLRATARLAGYIHDWGKANNHFQGVVRQNMKDAQPKRFLPHQPQLLRHETVSMLLAWEFKDWLEQAEGDFMIALAAAGGHHLKLGGRNGKCTDELGEIRQAGDNELYLYTIDANNKYYSGFKGLIRFGKKSLGLPKPKLSKKPSMRWTISDIKSKQREIITAYESWQYDPVFLAIVKALVISADAIASAIPQTNLSIKDFITNKSISHTINESELQQVIDNRLNGNELRPFQKALGKSTARVTLARAGCGTGKTVGAYNWAKTHALERKLIFCYPTTGTSTEGFIDYVHNQLDSVLLHGRADVDLAQLPQNLYATGEEEEADENEIANKLESFKAWGKKSIICTVDTVLGMLQCNRKPIYLFPVIAQSAFVFDEVHCYDDRLFGALLRFLEIVKAPILLMSASFLPWQLRAIEKAVGEQIAIIQGSKKLESHSRYNFYYQPEPNWETIETELNDGGKVLWVCNQVNTAINIYKQAKSQGLNALLYHSRYRYGDRVQHHRAVVDGFKQDKPILAITTQVAEMSLDLSATLLISQIAEPAGLIQRLGRLNRQYCGKPLDAIFYPDDKMGFPYSQKQLDDGKKLVQSFGKQVTQAELAQWLENLEDNSQPETDSVLLDGEWRTYPTSLREAGFNITVLLEQNFAKITSIPAKELPRYTVPIPARNTQKWQRHKFYPIAPTNLWDYTSELGAYEIKEDR